MKKLTSLTGLIAGLVTLTWMAGCSDKGATAVVVAVSTEGAIPDDINRLRIVVNRGGTSPTLEPYDLPATARLPGTITIKPKKDGEISGPIKISVEGYLASPTGEQKRRVLRSATVSFISEKQKLLRMPLRFSCFDSSDCTDGMTCVGGECVNDHVDASSLPDFEEYKVQATGSGCFNERKCFAPEDTWKLELPKASGDSCTFDAPGEEGSFNLAMEWVAAQGSTVLLEQDPREGYSLRDGKVSLAPGLCNALKSQRVLAIFASKSCASKTPDQSLCEVPPGALPRNAIWRIKGPGDSLIEGSSFSLAGKNNVKINEIKNSDISQDLPQKLAQSLSTGESVFEFLPHGEIFPEAVTIHVPYVEGSTLTLLTASPGDNAWTLVKGASVHSKVMTAKVNHFSYFVVSKGDSGAGGHSGSAGVGGDGGAGGSAGAGNAGGEGGAGSGAGQGGSTTAGQGGNTTAGQGGDSGQGGAGGTSCEGEEVCGVNLCDSSLGQDPPSICTGISPDSEICKVQKMEWLMSGLVEKSLFAISPSQPGRIFFSGKDGMLYERPADASMCSSFLKQRIPQMSMDDFHSLSYFGVDEASETLFLLGPNGLYKYNIHSDLKPKPFSPEGKIQGTTIHKMIISDKTMILRTTDNTGVSRVESCDLPACSKAKTLVSGVPLTDLFAVANKNLVWVMSPMGEQSPLLCSISMGNSDSFLQEKNCTKVLSVVGTNLPITVWDIAVIGDNVFLSVQSDLKKGLLKYECSQIPCSKEPSFLHLDSVLTHLAASKDGFLYLVSESGSTYRFKPLFELSSRGGLVEVVMLLRDGETSLP